MKADGRLFEILIVKTDPLQLSSLQNLAHCKFLLKPFGFWET